jgi:excisionase family DNA binding protein
MAYNPPSLPVPGDGGDTLYTPGEVAAIFRVDPKTVTRWAAAGRITSIRTPGGHRRFRKSEVDRLVRQEDGQQELSIKPVNFVATPTIRMLCLAHARPTHRPGPDVEAGAVDSLYGSRIAGWHEASASGTPSFATLGTEKRQPCRRRIRE